MYNYRTCHNINTGYAFEKSMNHLKGIGTVAMKLGEFTASQLYDNLLSAKIGGWGTNSPIEGLSNYWGVRRTRSRWAGAAWRLPANPTGCGSIGGEGMKTEMRQ